MTTRKSISKSTRFSVFARCDFTCQYCGKQPPEVKLVIEHIIPVYEGGTSDEANLTAACEGCNQGKGKKLLESFAPNGADERARAQDLLEQIDLARLAAEAYDARQLTREHVEEYFCKRYELEKAKPKDLTRLVNLILEFNVFDVYEWIDTAHANGVFANKAVRYINGIARNVREQS